MFTSARHVRKQKDKATATSRCHEALACGLIASCQPTHRVCSSSSRNTIARFINTKAARRHGPRYLLLMGSCGSGSSSSASMTASWPSTTARAHGVAFASSVVSASGFAPAARSTRTASGRLCSDAKCSGVRPCAYLQFTLAFALSNALTSSTLPAEQAFLRESFSSTWFETMEASAEDDSDKVVCVSIGSVRPVNSDSATLL
mmetsp:Transcript_56130/g.144504  ORF Transcript_56130/g.144504 Transcript_56130/m.144504 type:complete len:203 (+) Transcript_56130:1111-1719(+)